MFSIRTAVTAALVLGLAGVSPASALDNDSLVSSVFGPPIELQVAEGEQIFCSEFLRQIGENTFIFALDGDTPNEDRCAEPPHILEDGSFTN